MGQIADDVVSGRMCSTCGTMFQREHGYPVQCNDCWKHTSPEDRKTMGVSRAMHKEI